MLSSQLSTTESLPVAVWPAPAAPQQVPGVAAETATCHARVLHIINGEHFSGAERVQQLLGKRLPRFGFEPEFACVKPGRFPELCELRSEQVTEHAMRSRLDFSVVRSLARMAERQHYGLLHAHTPRTALITSLVALRTGIPWVYHVHSPTARDSTRPLVNRINDMLERYAIRSCQQVITVSKSLRREMLSRGVPRQRLAVVPNGVPGLDPIDAARRVSRQAWRLGIVALMRPRKGVEVALQAMSRLQRNGKQIQLDLIGGFESEGYRQQILEMISALQLESVVRLTGFTNDVPAAIGQLDALLLPSLFGEGMPMVVLEAMAAAVPVIATRVEGTPEVVRDGVEGLLAEPRDAISLASKIEQMTSNRTAWLEMSCKSLMRHRLHFTDVRMAERVAACYQSLLSRGGPVAVR